MRLTSSHYENLSEEETKSYKKEEFSQNRHN